MSDDKLFIMTRLKYNEQITDPEFGCTQLPRKKWGCQLSYYVLITLLLLVLTILKITDFGFTSFAHQTMTNSNICDTEDCISSAKYIAGSMNKSIDPCEDFYQFACGNFRTSYGIPKKSQINNIFMTMEYTILKNIRDVMEKDISDNEPNSILKSRQLYRSCTATDRMDAIGLGPLNELLNKLDLPLQTDSDIWFIIANINRYTNLNYLFSLNIEKDINMTSYSRITLSQPISESFLLLPQKLTESIRKINPKKIKKSLLSESRSIKTTEDYFIAVWEAIYQLQPYSPSVSSDELKEKFILVESIENKLKEINTIMDTDEPYLELISVDDLQLLTDNWTQSASSMTIFNWRQYITTQFADVKNVTINFETDFIQLENARYIFEVFKMLTTFSANTFGEHILWRVISTFLPYTTNQMRSLQYTFFPNTDHYSSRSLYCAHVVNNMMGFAIANVLNDSELMKRNRLMLEEIMKNIHEAFENIVNELKWMDDASKNKTLYKARKMKEIIGYPDFIMEPNRLDAYYSDFEVIEDDFFGNVIRYSQRELRNKLVTLRQIAFNRTDTWIDIPYEVNAFNVIIANLIVVPVGILQYPIFGHNLQVLNYGSLGTIIGHEITHGFDNSGRLFDVDGNLNMWWSHQTEVNFNNLTDCFIRQYDTFSMPGTQNKVNGKLTLDENIADNGGLRAAFWAYRKFVAENGEGKKLPGLEDFSEEQIFFLAFANNWCEAATNDLFLGNSKDQHSPKNVRTTAVVINSDEFSQVWKCEKGTKMNPDKEKCRIW